VRRLVPQKFQGFDPVGGNMELVAHPAFIQGLTDQNDITGIIFHQEDFGGLVAGRSHFILTWQEE
jgi:hypothetical protein